MFTIPSPLLSSILTVTTVLASSAFSYAVGTGTRNQASILAQSVCLVDDQALKTGDAIQAKSLLCIFGDKYACRVAAAGGDPEAQYMVSLMYKKGDGVEKDSDEALKLLKAFAENGYAQAQYRLGLWYSKHDSEKALKWFLRAAYQGDVKAAKRLYEMYQYGWGVERDYDKADLWARIAEAGGITHPVAESRKPVDIVVDHVERLPTIRSGSSRATNEQSNFNSGSGNVCADGSISHAAHRRGMCSHHGGLAR